MGCTHSQISKDDSSGSSSGSSVAYTSDDKPYQAPRPRILPKAAASEGAQKASTRPTPATQRQHHARPPVCRGKAYTCKIRFYPDLTVIFRLKDSGKVDGFCVHWSSDVSASTDKTRNFANHTFFDLSKSTGPPRRLYCYSPQSRICYVVAREIYLLLLAGVTTPGPLYTKLSNAVQSLNTRCIICRCALGAAIHRPTLCSSTTCLREFFTADLNIRCEDMFTQTSAASILLASVQAVSQTNSLNLLPGWPVSRLGNPGDALTMIQSLPSLAYPLSSSDMNQVLSSHYTAFEKAKQAEVLLSWMSTRFRGSLLTAYGTYIIPSLKGVSQFLLVNAQPENEASFAKHNRLRPRHILYHGTSIDRLYSVLVQGLQVLSGTPLAQNGAVYGSGIYMAREPNTALYYARASIPKTTTPIPHLKTDVSTAKLLLVCEHAGQDTSTPSKAPQGIHIIQDPSRIMVRYIFIIPAGSMPKASALNASILKNIKDLRDTL